MLENVTMRWLRTVLPYMRMSLAALGCVATQIPSSAATIGADAEELRACLSALIASPRAAGHMATTLERLLTANRRAFEQAADSPQAAHWFGAGGRAAEGDYDLYGRVVDSMRQQAKASGGSEYTRAVIALVRNLRPVVRENAEWSEELASAVGDLAGAAPESYVRYLSELQPDARRAVIDELWVTCERHDADALRKLIENDLSLPGDRSIRQAGGQVVEYLRRGCTLPK